MFGDFMGQTAPGRENDRPGNLRTLYLSDGNSLTIEAKGQYGFWFISYDKGKTPDDIKNQAFTSPSQAEQFVRTWFNNNRYNTKIVDKPVSIPEVKYKKEPKEV